MKNLFISSKSLLFYLMATSFNAVSQTTVSYTMQVANMNAHHTINTNAKFVAGHYNNGASELGTYANDNGAQGSYQGNPGTASFRLFSVNGLTTGASRSLKVGDEFKITVYVGNNFNFFDNSNAGISLNNGTASAGFSNFDAGQRLKMQINKGGSWLITGQNAAAGSATPGQDVTLTVLITSDNTANVTISSANGASTSELQLSGSGSIESFCIWNQSSGSGNDMYWKNCSVTSKGDVTIGEFVQSNSLAIITGVISDGFAANSTSTVSSNSLTKKGSGTITITGANSYTGATTVESGTLIVSGAGALGQGSDVVVDVGATLRIENSITINSLTNNGTVVVTSSGTLNVTGAIVNNGSFTVLADNSGFGQLKSSAASNAITGSANITQQQYLNGAGHHSISSSMTNGFTTSGANTSALYSYDASTGAYNMSPNATSAGEGYFAPVGTNGFLSASGVFSVSGTPVTSLTQSLGFFANQQAGGSGSGWNLIGNPYTCSLDWSTVSTPIALNDAIYIWDPNTSSYKIWVDGITQPNSGGSHLASDLIAPMQAFWVQTTAATSISTSMAANGSTTSTVHYKNNPDNLILVAQEVGDSTKADAMWLKNIAGTTLGFEGSEDAWKMTNYGGQPMIYSVDLEEKLAINAIDLNGTTVTPIGFSAPNAGGKYRITLEQVVNGLPYTAILEDKLFGTFTDLTQGDYSFTHARWQAEGPRFALHTMGAALDQPEQQGEATIAYQDGERIMVRLGQESNAQLTIHSLDGRMIRQVQANQTLTSIDMAGTPSGMYLIEVRGSNSHILKVFYQN